MSGPQFLSRAALRSIAIHVAWRPGYEQGGEVAGSLKKHFTRRLYQDFVGGAGLPLFFHAIPSPGGGSLFRINWRGAVASATVLLLDRGFPGDAAAVTDVERLVGEAKEIGPGVRLIPVAMEEGALPAGFRPQALRWDRWGGDEVTRATRLVRELSHAFCLLLLGSLRDIETGRSEAEADSMREHVRVFLSHSKHDTDGERITKGLRDWMDRNTPLSTFFDLRDIPPGADFVETLEREIEQSAFVVVHTDSYSARSVCQKEILDAKRNDRPILVLNSLREGEDRTFPYLGNVRTLRVDPDGVGDADYARISGALLDEVFRHLLWKCRVAAFSSEELAASFPTRPPEALSLSIFRGRGRATPSCIPAQGCPGKKWKSSAPSTPA